MGEREPPARTVHRITRRYCRARLGRSRAGYAAADDLAARVAAQILRDHRDELAGPRPLEAVIYADLAAAVDHAAAGAAVERTGRHTWSHTAPSEAVPASFGEPDPMLRELDRLPARTREVVVLRAMVGLTSEQVGRALGLAPDAVTAEQQRALTLLRGD